jgi:prepilin-type N-terminal cleavage/methylation domain-containing protein
MKKGFSLTELLIAVVIIALAGGPLVYMFISSNKGTRAEVKYFAAMLGTQKVVETYLKAVYKNPKAVLEDGSFTENDVKYDYTVKYEPVKNEKQLYKVTITTTWGGFSKAKYKLSFLISKKYFLRIDQEEHTAWDEIYGKIDF